MAHTAQPQVQVVSTNRAHRALLVALVAVVITAGAAYGIASWSSDGVSRPAPTVTPSTQSDAGPVAGTASAVSEATIHRTSRGISLTTNVPALPVEDAGPVSGTPAAVSAAMSSAPALTIPDRRPR